MCAICDEVFSQEKLTAAIVEDYLSRIGDATVAGEESSHFYDAINHLLDIQEFESDPELDATWEDTYRGL